MELVFLITTYAEHVEVVAPYGFDVGRLKGPDGETDACLLMGHTIPRLKKCEVAVQEGRVTMRFRLWNPLEPQFITKTGGTRQPKYSFQFFVKSPDHCPMKGVVNKHGACKMPDDKPKHWHWSLLTFYKAKDLESVDVETQGFEIYDNRAKEWHAVESPKEDAISERRDEEFVEGSLSEEDMSQEEITIKEVLERERADPTSALSSFAGR